jgi:hypothetical protein
MKPDPVAQAVNITPVLYFLQKDFSSKGLCVDRHPPQHDSNPTELTFYYI